MAALNRLLAFGVSPISVLFHEITFHGEQVVLVEELLCWTRKLPVASGQSQIFFYYRAYTSRRGLKHDHYDVFT
jgi:hypothetical protein